MKLNNIFLILTVVAGTMFSCVSEDILGPTPNKPAGQEEVIAGLPTTLSLKLGASGIETKATYGVALDYTKASKDELFVDKCAVAIFDVDANDAPTTLKYFKYFSSVTQTTTSHTPDDTLAYKVDGIQTTTGKSLIMVIANMPNTSDIFNGLTTYNAFKTLLVETVFPATYDPKTLIKTGELITNLSTTNALIEVPMTQLAAKIKFGIKLDMGVISTTDVIDIDDTDQTNLDLWGRDLNSVHDRATALTDGKFSIRIDPITFVKDTLIIFHCKTDTDHDDLLFDWEGVNYRIGNIGGRKVVQLEGLFIDSVKSTVQWALKIKEITVSGIQSVGTPGSGFPDEQLQTELWKRDFTTLPDGGMLITEAYADSFYTYEKSLEIETATPLTINYKASLAKTTFTETTRYKVSGHGLWIRPDGTGIKGGWSSTDAKFVFIPSSLSTPIGLPVNLPPTQSTADVFKEYQMKVLDQGVNIPIESGWMYDILATMDISFTTRAADTESFATTISRAYMPWTR